MWCVLHGSGSSGLGYRTPERCEMYLARVMVKNRMHYCIRQSMENGDGYCRRDLFDLGRRPGEFIVYPGGSSFYIHEVVTDALEKGGASFSDDELEDIFWPFLKPDIRRALDGFRRRAKSYASRPGFSKEEKERIIRRSHLFDKRRIHYLRCGGMDQGNIGLLPVKLFNWLARKSRDEIEQRFMKMEHALRPDEYKTYVYVAFDLQRFFHQSFARKLPRGLDQDKVDSSFIKEICRLNGDASFWAGEAVDDVLHDHLKRYVIMFFDNEYGRDSFLEDQVKAFMNRHRFFAFPTRGASVSYGEAGKTLGATEEVLRSMSREEVTRLFRKKARKLHPDMGGNHETFIQLVNAYKGVMERKKNDDS